MGELNEIERGQLCQSTIESLYEATGGLKQFPGLLKKIIDNEAWKRRINKGRVIELSSLRELITEKPIRGWGEDPRKVEAVIKDDPECLAKFREAMKEQGRRTDLCSNPTEVTGQPSNERGKAYTCERLRRESPELFEEVKAGRMSANAAAIKAGIRKKSTPEDACLKAFRKCSDLTEMLRRLQEYYEVAMRHKESTDGRRLD